MILKTDSQRPWYLGSMPCGVAAMLMGTLIWPGCGKDAHLADHRVRDVDVASFTAYETELDTKATPEQVVFVFLKAVVDDYDAGNDIEARERAFDIQLRTAAAARIKKAVDNDGRLTPERLRERFYSAVRHWAPVIGYYVDDFRVDFDTLTSRMYTDIRSGTARREEADVYLNVTYTQPGAENGTDSAVVAQFKLVKESGFWRIWSVGWNNSTRDWTVSAPRGVTIRAPAEAATGSQPPAGQASQSGTSD